MPELPYSRCLFRLAGLTGFHQINVPPGYLWIMRDIDVYGNMTIDRTADILVSELFSDATIAWFHFDLGERRHDQWVGRQVIPYTQGLGGLQIRNEETGPCDVSISGYVLSDPSATAP